MIVVPVVVVVVFVVVGGKWITLDSPLQRSPLGPAAAWGLLGIRGIPPPAMM
jgi:hypothetical protein